MFEPSASRKNGIVPLESLRVKYSSMLRPVNTTAGS
jgi:hypothetical protein